MTMEAKSTAIAALRKRLGRTKRFGKMEDCLDLILACLDGEHDQNVEDINELREDLERQISALDSRITTIERNYATKSQISSVEADVTSLTNRVSALEAGG